MLKVSLITASYNSAKTISDTLVSVKAQSYDNIEHLIVDGASTDNTLEIVKAIGTHVAYSNSEPDKGIYDAFNKGLSHATGDIIGFINSDDFYYSNDVIREVVESFGNEAVDAVHGDLIYVDKDDVSKPTRYWKSGNCNLHDLARGRFPAHPALFLRRSVYDRVGGFNCSYKLAADAEFMLRVFKRDDIKAVYVARPWVKMREGGATGGTLRSLISQNREIRHAQQIHGLKSSLPNFVMTKLVDRAIQKYRSMLPIAPMAD